MPPQRETGLRRYGTAWTILHKIRTVLGSSPNCKLHEEIAEVDESSWGGGGRNAAFPWIKGVLAPLAGQLLPRNESEVFAVWRRAGTVTSIRRDVADEGYLSPFPDVHDPKERDVFTALERIGVMFRRKDGRVDMPDLFRVAARLLKKGGTAPL